MAKYTISATVEILKVIEAETPFEAKRKAEDGFGTEGELDGWDVCDSEVTGFFDLDAPQSAHISFHEVNEE